MRALCSGKVGATPWNSDRIPERETSERIWLWLAAELGRSEVGPCDSPLEHAQSNATAAVPAATAKTVKLFRTGWIPPMHLLGGKVSVKVKVVGIGRTFR
jgi:hypothetical protein